MNPAEIPILAKAVNRWLSYQLLCGREALLSEAYLGQPLAEFLIHRHSGAFETEVDHPVLNKPGPGRPRQIDYILRTPSSKAMDVAIECKWISERPYDRQRVLNDVLRLECVRVTGQYVKRYFLVAGLRDHFVSNFKDLEVNTPTGRAAFTGSILSFSPAHPDKAIRVQECNARLQQFYKAFEAAFNAEVPVSFKTKMLGYKTADNISVAIWQIASVKNRSLFSPSLRWPDG